jgi:hypothetical protein
MRFSQRYGYTPVNTVIQKESISDSLHNRLWNVLTTSFWDHPYEHKSNVTLSVETSSLIRAIWHSFYQLPIDTIPKYWGQTLNTIRSRYFSYEWYRVYDFLEFIANNYSSRYPSGTTKVERFTAACNTVLKEELSAWRFVGTIIAPITSDAEIESIDQAQSGTGALAPVSQQIHDALEILADRQAPITKYRDSIKHSISAVETLCKLITNQPTTTLGVALNTIAKNNPVLLHQDLNDAFKKLYHWTSDAQGIRHGLMDDPNLDLEDALYMLVACSAFINHMITKASKAGITL